MISLPAKDASAGAASPSSGESNVLIDNSLGPRAKVTVMLAQLLTVAEQVRRPMLLGVDGLAFELGYSPREIRRMDAAGKLPMPTVARRRGVRWSREDIQAWVRAGMPDRKTWSRTREARGAATLEKQIPR